MEVKLCLKLPAAALWRRVNCLFVVVLGRSCLGEIGNQITTRDLRMSHAFIGGVG